MNRLSLMTKAISILLVLAFLSSQAYAQSFDSSNSTLAPASAMGDIDPARSSQLKRDAAEGKEPGAIGNGEPLVQLAKGVRPLRIDMQDNVAEKLRESIISALSLCAAHRGEVPPEHADRFKSATRNLVDLSNHLNDKTYLYHADVRTPEDYLLGFNFHPQFGFSVELINRLYSISPRRLAQYVFHETVPEHGVTDRDDHRVVYKEIQTAIFGEEEVLALKRDLREFIDEKVSDGQRIDKLAQDIHYVRSNIGNFRFDSDSEHYVVFEHTLPNATSRQIIGYDLGMTAQPCFIFSYDFPVKDNEFEFEFSPLRPSLVLIKSYSRLDNDTRQASQAILTDLTPNALKPVEIGHGNKAASLGFDAATGNVINKSTNEVAWENKLPSFSISSEKMQTNPAETRVTPIEVLQGNEAIGKITLAQSLENREGREVDGTKIHISSWFPPHMEPIIQRLAEERNLRTLRELVLFIIENPQECEKQFRLRKDDRLNIDDAGYLFNGVLMASGSQENAEVIMRALIQSEEVRKLLPLFTLAVVLYDITGESGIAPGSSDKTFEKVPTVESFLTHLRNTPPLEKGYKVIESEQVRKQLKDVLKRLGIITMPTQAPSRREATQVTTVQARSPQEFVVTDSHPTVLQSEELRAHAEMFAYNLTKILAQHPDQLFFIGIETDIGESQKSQIMPIYTAIDEIKDMKDNITGKPLFPNLMVRRAKAGELASMVVDFNKAESVLHEGVKFVKLDLNHAFIGARKISADSGVFNSIKGEGRAWIAAIDDSGAGDYIYMPVFEAITLTMMAYLEADIPSIKNFYDAIADKPIDPDALQDMIRNRIIYILPRATKFDTKQLRELYELAHQVYIAA